MAPRTRLITLMLATGLGLRAAAALAADPAPAPATPGARAIMVRQARQKDLNLAFRGVSVELKKDAPDKAVLTTSAGQVKDLAAALPSWFPKGSGPETGAPTAARAEIWTDAAGFAAAATRLQVEAAKLAEAATAGDPDGLKAQVRATEDACKACHEKYRAREKHGR